MGWNGSTLSRHLVTPAHVKTRRGATALGASGQTQSALPCRPGNSLVAQGEVPSIGNGAMRQVFFTARGIFFRAIADFPVPARKKRSSDADKGGMSENIYCHPPEWGISHRPKRKNTTCSPMKQKKNPQRHHGSGAAPSAPCRRGKQRDEKLLLRLLEAFLPQDPGAGCDGCPG